MQFTTKMLYLKKEKEKSNGVTISCHLSCLTVATILLQKIIIHFFSLYFSFKKSPSLSLSFSIFGPVSFFFFFFFLSSLWFSPLLTNESWWCWIVIFEPLWWIVVRGSHRGWSWFMGDRGFGFQWFTPRVIVVCRSRWFYGSLWFCG